VNSRPSDTPTDRDVHADTNAARAVGLEDPADLRWPGGLTRVPYWVFQRPDVYAREGERVFQGPYWNYLCLEADVPEGGDFRTTFAGEAPVIVTRDADGELYAFENRCAHRGALLAYNECGKAKNFTCIYHAWSYNMQGDLIGVAFKDGVNGRGGMSSTFRMQDHGPRKLRVATVHGLVFGSFHDDVPPIEEYLGEAILGHIERVLGGRKPVVLGRFEQMLPNNWKLYMENVKDSYHASILHLFFTTFEMNRLSQRGAIVVDESGGHHVSYSAIDLETRKDDAYAQQKLRAESQYSLSDPSLLQSFDEFPDGITLQILSVFPGFVLQQIQNSIAVRQVLPRGIQQTQLGWTYLGFADDTPEQRRVRMKQSNLIGPSGFISMEDGCVGGFVQRGIAGASQQQAVLEMGGATADSSDSRTTEASIRGFWKAYRAAMAF
jgi:anthranilate 1,2-dioxygenase large subunit